MPCKFALYEALVGAKRPMTEISKDKETEVWTVTKLVDAKGEPIMKPVSAYDIDNIFSKMVDMFMDDAVTMGMVVNETRTVENVTFAYKADLRGDAVVALAEKYVSGEVDKAELARLVKAEIPFAAEIPEDQFAKHLEEALGDGHRAAGGAEVRLHNMLKLLHQVIQKFANVPMRWYMTKVNA